MAEREKEPNSSSEDDYSLPDRLRTTYDLVPSQVKRGLGFLFFIIQVIISPIILAFLKSLLSALASLPIFAIVFLGITLMFVAIGILTILLQWYVEAGEILEDRILEEPTSKADPDNEHTSSGGHRVDRSHVSQEDTMPGLGAETVSGLIRTTLRPHVQQSTQNEAALRHIERRVSKLESSSPSVTESDLQRAVSEVKKDTVSSTTFEERISDIDEKSEKSLENTYRIYVVVKKILEKENIEVEGVNTDEQEKAKGDTDPVTNEETTDSKETEIE